MQAGENSRRKVQNVVTESTASNLNASVFVRELFPNLARVDPETESKVDIAPYERHERHDVETASPPKSYSLAAVGIEKPISNT
jgi:hypothetical protein